MKTAVVLFLGMFLFSCVGPVMMAKTEGEAIKRGYSDPDLAGLNQKYEPLLRGLYSRFTLAKVDTYPEGLGFTGLQGKDGKKYYYLQVGVRPRNICFDENKTTSKERFAAVLQKYFATNLRYMKKEDIDRDDIGGLAFAVYWPVRDFSQCDTNGGFIEYAEVYMNKADVFDILNGTVSFMDVAERSEVIASLDMAQPVRIKVIER